MVQFEDRFVASVRRRAINRFGGKSIGATGSLVVGTWRKCQHRREAVTLFSSCAVAGKQDHHLG